ncbi:unnamed protein product [Thelazia callipaeda]|uniref:LAM_G_DOMAIN domain-containing protein n=1 Tax=Thelazia callipaeda TaxID=103827 RepID=A0A0N5CSD6_THECL|nr:unnamed protein product [Thelazia callipaeda]
MFLITSRTAVVPMSGCVEHVKLENRLLDLSKSKTAKGVQPGCSTRTVRIVSMVSERSTAAFTGFDSKKNDIELTLRFKTKRPSGILASVISDEQETLLQLRYQDGFLLAEYGSDNKDLARIEFRSVADGQWHYFAVIVKPKTIRLDVDDLYSNEVHRTVDDNEVIGIPTIIHFGRSTDSNMHFEGCIGDATYNGQLLDFALGSTQEVSLTGCSLPEDIFATYMSPAELPTGEPLNFAKPASSNVQLETDALDEFTAENKISVEMSSASHPKAVVRKPDECALLRKSYGERPDSGGTRFGLSVSSRLEFEKPPASFDKNSIFSVQLRATASNGIIMFTTNNKHTDHLALYLVNGIVHFAYNSGSGQAVLKSNRSVMDDEWHSIRAEREGVAGTLYIDDVIEANGQSPPGTDAVDTHPPIYIGGLPSDLVPFASRILPGAKSVFGGCLRDFKLNEMKFDVPPAEIGTVGSSFNIELEVRSRTKTGVLLSVGVLEYLTLQFFNGTVKFTVDNGAGPEIVSHIPSSSNALCDGHWHHIKLYKTKNLMTLTVDGRSNLSIMKKGKKTDTNTKDPLYLGGIPKGTRPRSLETSEGFLGCVRVLNLGTKPRKRKNVDLTRVSLFGDVTRNSCPVN